MTCRMGYEGWQRLGSDATKSDLYHDALTRPPDERSAFLTEACGDDETLRAEVESLLRLGVRPDATAVPLPPIFVQAPFARHRFVPGGKRLLYVQSQNGYDDFWMLDLLTRETRQVAHVTGQASIWGFDITPDGKRIVFDRHHENSNIVLIERPRKP